MLVTDHATTKPISKAQKLRSPEYLKSVLLAIRYAAIIKGMQKKR